MGVGEGEGERARFSLRRRSDLCRVGYTRCGSFNMMLSCDSSRLDTETFQEKSVRLLPRLIAADDRAISECLNMLVKQNLLLI